jgi:hypothetical protein
MLQLQCAGLIRDALCCFMISVDFVVVAGTTHACARRERFTFLSVMRRVFALYDRAVCAKE